MRAPRAARRPPADPVCARALPPSIPHVRRGLRAVSTQGASETKAHCERVRRCRVLRPRRCAPPLSRLALAFEGEAALTRRRLASLLARARRSPRREDTELEQMLQARDDLLMPISPAHGTLAHGGVVCATGAGPSSAAFGTAAAAASPLPGAAAGSHVAGGSSAIASSLPAGGRGGRGPGGPGGPGGRGGGGGRGAAMAALNRQQLGHGANVTFRPGGTNDSMSMHGFRQPYTKLEKVRAEPCARAQRVRPWEQLRTHAPRAARALCVPLACSARHGCHVWPCYLPCLPCVCCLPRSSRARASSSRVARCTLKSGGMGAGGRLALLRFDCPASLLWVHCALGRLAVFAVLGPTHLGPNTASHGFVSGLVWHGWSKGWGGQRARGSGEGVLGVGREEYCARDDHLSADLAVTVSQIL
jgi:hypothetical protein